MGSIKRLSFFLIAVLILVSPSYARAGDLERSKQNVLLILIDTLRADHLGVYGYHRDTSPRIDAIAKKGIVFDYFYSSCNWTFPAIVSLFSGQYPQSVFPAAGIMDAVSFVIPDKVQTLAEVLRRSGFRTSGIMLHPGIRKRLGYAQGFETFHSMPKELKDTREGWAHISSERVFKAVRSQLEKFGKGHFFLYLHVVYPHKPYHSPPPFNEMFGTTDYKKASSYEELSINGYDGEIRYTDRLVGWIFDDLRKRGLLKNTYVIVTSDHGEGFGEHGHYGHGNAFYEEAIRIPLIIYPPGGRTSQRARIDERLGSIDLFPTIADLAGVNKIPPVTGKSLRRCFHKRCAEEAIFSESPHDLDIAAVTVIDRDMKYIFSPNRGDDMHMLFDLDGDRSEKNDLSKEKQKLQDRLHALIQAHDKENLSKRSKLKQSKAKLSESIIRGLKSLGYLQ